MPVPAAAAAAAAVVVVVAVAAAAATMVVTLEPALISAVRARSAGLAVQVLVAALSP